MFLARTLEWGALASPRGSPRAKDRTQVPFIEGRFFTTWAAGEAQGEERQGREVCISHPGGGHAQGPGGTGLWAHPDLPWDKNIFSCGQSLPWTGSPGGHIINQNAKCFKCQRCVCVWVWERASTCLFMRYSEILLWVWNVIASFLSFLSFFFKVE